MSKKLTIQEVRKFVETNSKCTLISTEYINMKTKMEFRCGCDNIFPTSFDEFKNMNKRQCNKCGHKSISLSKLGNLEEIKLFVKENSNCECLETEYINSNTKMKFRCDCNNIFYTSINTFKNMNKRQCEKCGREKQSISQSIGFNKFIDYIKQNTNLIPLNKEYKNVYTKMDFICECGKEFKTTLSNIKRANKRQCTSCGIKIRTNKIRKTIDDVTDYITKMELNIILITKEYINNRTKMDFICECGKEFKTSFERLRGGQISCRVCSQKETKGEREIRLWLESNNIRFIQEKRFNNCIGLTKYKTKLPFDFYVSKYNLCIEYDGRQHYKLTRFRGMSEEKAIITFERTQINDEIKNKYCKDNNIKLVRLWEMNVEK